jgi:transposase
MTQVNRNRLKDFRQLKQEVKYSEEYLIVGIDIAKDRHHAFSGAAMGKRV